MFKDVYFALTPVHPDNISVDIISQPESWESLDPSRVVTKCLVKTGLACFLTMVPTVPKKSLGVPKCPVFTLDTKTKHIFKSLKLPNLYYINSRNIWVKLLCYVMCNGSYS